MPVPNNIRVLVLNDDFTPLNVVGWKTGMKRQFTHVRCEHCSKGRIKERYLDEGCSYCNGTGRYPKAQAIQYYDIWIKDGSGNEYPIPAVIRNQHHIKRTYRKLPFSRYNVFRRDGHYCQYCGEKFPSKELTIDHVVPRAMWNGPSTPTCWTNIVTSCHKCNEKKRDRTPEQAKMSLSKKIWTSDGKVITVKYKNPKHPSFTDMIIGISTSISRIPEEWEPYIGSLIDK